MLIKNSYNRCFVMIFMILVMGLVPGALSASHSVMLGSIPEYAEESQSWCGPAVAQMIMNGYPSGAQFKFQEDVWDVIQNSKVEPMWSSDPVGLRDAMQTLNPPGLFGHWEIFQNANKQELMYSVAYWMTSNNYPAAVLLNTLPHNSTADHEEHWVEVRGIITDVDPTISGNTSIDLQFLWYTDPSPAILGNPAVTSFISGSTWYSMLQTVTKAGSAYNGKHVAIIEPPQISGIAIAPKEILSGKPLGPDTALTFARKWIEEYKLYNIEAYKNLKNATPLKPLLVDKKHGGYYLIPYVTTRGMENSSTSLSVLINAYEGNFQQVGVFQPTRYLSEQEAKKIALNYMRIKRAKSINAELVTRINGHYFGSYFPAWKIIIDEEVIHVTQKGRVISTYLPPDEPSEVVCLKKWSFSVHSGITIPDSYSGNFYKSSYMFAIDLDYQFNPRLSAVALLGFNHLKAKSDFFYLENTHWWNLSANLKWKFPAKTLSPYVNGGFGLYKPEEGSAYAGYNVGAGIDRSLNPNLEVEVGANFHHILTSMRDPEFFTVHAGLIFHF